MANDKVDDGADLGLGGRVWSGALLLEFLAPARRKIPVEIEPLQRALDFQRKTIVAVIAALGHDPVVGSPGLGRVTPHHQAWLLRMRFPQAVGIGNAHLQDAPVAVDVLDDEAIRLLFVERIRTRRRTHPFRPVRKRPFRAVGIDPRANVESPRVERARHLGIRTVLSDQRVDEIERGRRRRHFGRMDVPVDPERRLFGCGSGRAVGDRQHPDVAAFMTLPDRLDRDELRVLARERAENAGELGVAIKAVEGDRRHLGRWRGRLRTANVPGIGSTDAQASGCILLHAPRPRSKLTDTVQSNCVWSFQRPESIIDRRPECSETNIETGDLNRPDPRNRGPILQEHRGVQPGAPDVPIRLRRGLDPHMAGAFATDDIAHPVSEPNRLNVVRWIATLGCRSADAS